MKRFPSHGTDWLISVCLIVLIPILAAVAIIDRQRSHDLRAVVAIDAWALYDAALHSCLRGNVVRAKQAEIIRAAGLEVKPIPLVDCLATIPDPIVPRPEEENLP